MLLDTTLLSSPLPLVYGTGVGLNLGSGEPALNKVNHTNYFSGRSDNSSRGYLRRDRRDGRLDPEGIRVSNNGQSVFLTDEYGPYMYEFDRTTGKRIKSIKLPANLAITKLSEQKTWTSRKHCWPVRQGHGRTRDHARRQDTGGNRAGEPGAG